MNGKIAKVIASFICLGVLAALCPAPINGYKLGITPPPYQPPASQQELQQQQKLQKVEGVVGSVSNSNPNQGFSNGTGSETAQNALAQAGSKIQSPESRAEGLQVLKQAAHPEQKESNHAVSLIVMFFGVGLLSVFGLKKWADAKIGGPGDFPKSKPIL